MNELLPQLGQAVTVRRTPANGVVTAVSSSLTLPDGYDRPRSGAGIIGRRTLMAQGKV